MGCCLSKNTFPPQPPQLEKKKIDNKPFGKRIAKGIFEGDVYVLTTNIRQYKRTNENEQLFGQTVKYIKKELVQFCKEDRKKHIKTFNCLLLKAYQEETNSFFPDALIQVVVDHITPTPSVCILHFTLQIQQEKLEEKKFPHDIRPALEFYGVASKQLKQIFDGGQNKQEKKNIDGGSNNGSGAALTIGIGGESNSDGGAAVTIGSGDDIGGLNNDSGAALTIGIGGGSNSDSGAAITISSGDGIGGLNNDSGTALTIDIGGGSNSDSGTVLTIGSGDGIGASNNDSGAVPTKSKE